MSEVKKWYEYLNDDVYNRLRGCNTIKEDMRPLVDARWQFLKDNGYDKKGYTREDALVYVLELLDSNGLDHLADISVDDYEDLKFEY